MANKGARVGGRTIDLIIEAVLVAVTWYLYGELQRFWTALFLAFAVIWAYDTATTTWWGGTIGKRAVGLRVVQLDHAGRPTLGAAAHRGALCAAMTTIPFLGWGLWLATTLGDAVGRGFTDRLAGTMVVPQRFVGPVATKDLPGYADASRPPRLVEQGRVADLDVRYRARLRRLTDAPVLAAAIGMLALAVSLPFSTLTLVLASSAAWIVVFVVDETLRVARTGRTPGHEIAGLVIVSRRTGRPPSGWRSFLRALVLGLTLYVPLLWPVLGGSLLAMRFADRGRGLHDIAGGTVVVSDPALSPEEQRQRAMRMRLGRAG